jgi:AcrR family transcriptional regulator
MDRPVKKSSYESPLRAAQAQATRRAIVAAAARLFIENGYGATTVDAIAQAAGVSRKTVFTSVGSKAAAIKLALDWAAVGDDEPITHMERPGVKALKQEPDARKILAGYAAMNGEIGARVSELHCAVEAVAGADDELRSLAESFAAQRRFGMGDLAEQLDSRGALRPGMSVDEAADVLCMMSSPANYRWFVLTRGWSAQHYAHWLRDALVSLLIDPQYRPPGTAEADTARRVEKR